MVSDDQIVVSNTVSVVSQRFYYNNNSWPIKTMANNPINQSERDDRTYSKRQARENSWKPSRLIVVSLLIVWKNSSVEFA